jgi:hypothetical protein
VAKRGWYFGYFLKTELTKFADGLDVEFVRGRVKKEGLKIF